MVDDALEAYRLVTCPFCHLSENESVVLETPNVRVIVDAAPLTEGHVLITTRDHFASAMDLSLPLYLEFRLVQSEIMRRLTAAYGSSGVYEHGRSRFCRYQIADSGLIHAHAHAVPLGANILRAENRARMSQGPFATPVSFGKQRYLYQNVGEHEELAHVSSRTPRHVVRSRLESELRRDGSTEQSAMKSSTHSALTRASYPDREREAMAAHARALTERLQANWIWDSPHGTQIIDGLTSWR